MQCSMQLLSAGMYVLLTGVRGGIPEDRQGHSQLGAQPDVTMPDVHLGLNPTQCPIFEVRWISFTLADQHQLSG